MNDVITALDQFVTNAEVNQLLTSWVMIGFTFGLGAVAVAYALLRWLDLRHEGDGTSQDHPTHPRPITVAH